ncbi:hypothetical protein [Brevibacillus laterosporus]|uniref:Uncharacterized protein n=1 Tax=Brevibacillus laterosporus TaxID=1465 RepID=A0AAP3GAI7_BRELA|nr:hypothetical protein [Brevibacillus laterosporus]MCR8982425.1 hypothetical protein [Brevibacillus laterosporus]MCZ0809581.1 hypothetical protein [Brevibacillus laterosporus]MCZ0828114.1 hypothetical protein [Brevibacillus laterosporus]MCZ0852136.1 hypothetical protein [Brevibacillus laterosporus]
MKKNLKWMLAVAVLLLIVAIVMTRQVEQEPSTAKNESIPTVQNVESQPMDKDQQAPTKEVKEVAFEIFVHDKKMSMNDLDQVQTAAVVFSDYFFNVEPGMKFADWRKRVKEKNGRYDNLIGVQTLTPAFGERKMKKLVLFPEYQVTTEEYLLPITAYYEMHDTTIMQQANLIIERKEGDQVGRIRGNDQTKKTLDWLYKKQDEYGIEVDYQNF